MKAILVLNTGSSSCKFALFEATPTLPACLKGQIEGLGSQVSFSAQRLQPTDQPHSEQQWAAGAGPSNHDEALAWILNWLQQNQPELSVVAVGHRIVHGGPRYHHAIPIDAAAIHYLTELIPLAPLHQPHNLAGVQASQMAFGAIPQIACFDTAFHRSHPLLNDCYALPRQYFEAGVRRYGFHGLSYEFITQCIRASYPQHAAGRLIVAHLGNGASMCAIHQGQSIACTMGFSALDGLAMGTRCGQIDPGVLLYLLTHEGLSPAQLTDLLYKQSGLKALSGGLSNDMRVLEQAHTLEAQQAIDYFVNAIRCQIGSLTATLNGLDALVFTGGIGENSVAVRQKTLQNMAWLGIELDQQSNQTGQTVLSLPQSKVLCLRLPTNEEHMIAQHTYNILASQSPLPT